MRVSTESGRTIARFVWKRSTAHRKSFGCLIRRTCPLLDPETIRIPICTAAERNSYSWMVTSRAFPEALIGMTKGTGDGRIRWSWCGCRNDGLLTPALSSAGAFRKWERRRRGRSPRALDLVPVALALQELGAEVCHCEMGRRTRSMDS